MDIFGHMDIGLPPCAHLGNIFWRNKLAIPVIVRLIRLFDTNSPAGRKNMARLVCLMRNINTAAKPADQ